MNTDFFSHDLLTLEEELELGRRIQAGDQEALNELVRHNTRLVKKAVSRVYSPDLATTWDDLIQEGMLGLFTAAKKYDPDRGLRFSTYATHWVQQKVGRACLVNGPIRRNANPNALHKTESGARAHALRQSPVARLDAPLIGRRGDESDNTLADQISDDSVSVEDQVFIKLEAERIWNALHFNERGQAILRDWLSGMPRREVEEKYGISHSWIHSMLKSRKERLMTTSTPKPCIEPGCNQPRYVNTNGTELTRCHEHQKEYWRKAAEAKKKPGQPPARHRRTAVDVSGIHPLLVVASADVEAAQTVESCACPDCIYREVISLLTARNPRIGELVEIMLTARRLRDELGI